MYDIQGKKEIDKTLGELITKMIDAGGGYPTKITVSATIYRKLERIFPSVDDSVLQYDSIPIVLDETLPGEQIIIQ